MRWREYQKLDLYLLLLVLPKQIHHLMWVIYASSFSQSHFKGLLNSNVNPFIVICYSDIRCSRVVFFFMSLSLLNLCMFVCRPFLCVTFPSIWNDMILFLYIYRDLSYNKGLTSSLPEAIGKLAKLTNL